MYGNVVDKYCNMSAAQFRKSYRAKQRIEKNEAHRKIYIYLKGGRMNNSSDYNMPPTTSLRSAPENNKKIGKRVKLTMETIATEEDRMECHNSLPTSISEKEHYLKTLRKKELCILYSCYGLKYNARK